MSAEIEVRIVWQKADGTDTVEFFDVNEDDEAELFATLNELQARTGD